MVRASAETVAAIDAGPIDAKDALPVAEVERLADPAPLTVETGWCWLPDGVGYAAVRTPMPGVSAEMIDWWFDWHPHSAERYKLWHPEAHFGTGLDPAPEPGAKPFWFTTHYTDEDVGTGREKLRIEFLPPSQVGFSGDHLEDPAVGTIVAGWVGLQKRHVRFARITHVFLKSNDGLVLRSRFWLGAGIRPDLPGRLGDFAGRVADRPFFRNRAIPRKAPLGLAHHCADEFANLAAILPDLFAQSN